MKNVNLLHSLSLKLLNTGTTLNIITIRTNNQWMTLWEGFEIEKKFDFENFQGRYIS